MLKQLARLWTASSHPGDRTAITQMDSRTTHAATQAEPAGPGHKKPGKPSRDWRPRLYW